MKGDNDSLVVTTVRDELTEAEHPLFQVPVQVCAAVSKTADVRFDVAGPSGGPRSQVYRDDATGEIVEDGDCPRGVRVGDAFIAVPDQARAAIVEATKLPYMRVEGAAPLADLLREYGHLVCGTYYLQAPDKGSPKAYRLLYEALRERRTPRGRVERGPRALVMKRTAKTRQRASLVYASEDHGCLVLLDIAFPADVKRPDEQVRGHLAAEVAEAQIASAREVIDGLPDGAEFLATCQDDTRVQRQELVDKAVAGEVIEAAPRPVVETIAEDALDAMLRASIAQTA